MKSGAFQEYFETRFSDDLAAFLSAMPAGQSKHYAKSPESWSIAMNYLVEPGLALYVIPKEIRPYFAASLYFTSLMDQAMYKYCQDCYGSYRRLTDFPKLTGACPGGPNTGSGRTFGVLNQNWHERRGFRFRLWVGTA